MDNQSLAHTSWNCKYHIVFAMPLHIAEALKNIRNERRMSQRADLQEQIGVIQSYIL